MKRFPFILLLVWIGLGFGCANLEVDVRAFNHDCFGQLDFLRAKALDRTSRMRALDQNNIYQEVEEALVAEAQTVAVTLKCVNGLQDPRDYCLDEKDVDDGRFVQAIGAKIKEKFMLALKHYREGIEQTNAGEKAPPDNTDLRLEHYAQALSSFYQGDEVMRKVRVGVESELGGEIEVMKAFAPFLNKVSKATQDLASGTRLFDDHLASAVITADKACWEPEYNSAHALGLVGNTDVAIKMEAAGDYSIKGVRLDSAAVTKATFGAVRQGIAIAAAAYGVPLPTAQQSDGSTLAQAVPELDSITNAQQEMEIQARLSKMAMWGLLNAVVQRREDFENSAKRKETFRSLQSIFSVYRPQLAGDMSP